MTRSHLKKGDVLLSIVGTIGELSLVGSDATATCSCKLAILRPRSINSEMLAVFLQSEHGRNQVERLTRGAIQKSLLLEDMDQLWVPSFSKDFSKRISKHVGDSKLQLERMYAEQADAEQLLIRSLGLANWKPPEPLSYVATSADAFAAGRLDAQFFAPRIRSLLDHLSRSGSSVGIVATPRRQQFNSELCDTFNYIEIGDLSSAGMTGSTPLLCDEAPSRATWHVRPGDIITSMVRPIRRLSAQILAEQDGFVCSSGFVVLQPTQVPPEVLLTYLRLSVICELMDLYASASMYPAISEADILALPFPTIDAQTADAICRSVQQSREARQCAGQLLETAKRAVDIAIQKSEGAALSFLEEVT